MAQTDNSGRDTGRKPASINKFWERPDFQEKIKRIREHEADTSPAVTAPTPEPTNVFDMPQRAKLEQEKRPRPSFLPIPTTTLSSVSTPTYGPTLPKKRPIRSTSFNQQLYDTELEKVVRDQVAKEFIPSAGVTKEKYKSRIEEEIAKRIDLIKRPRYVFLSDGTPYYLDKEDERADVERSLLSETPLKRQWTMLRYDAATGVGKILSAIGGLAVKTKEVLADPNQGNVAGGIAQLGLNSVLLAGEYLRVAGRPEDILANEEQARQWEQEAEAVKYTDPTKAQELLDLATNERKEIEAKKVLLDRVSTATQAVQNSWAELNEAVPYQPKGFDASKYTTDQERKMAYLEAVYAERTEAQQNATVVRTQVQSAMQTGNYEEALRLTRQAQEFDQQADPASPYNAYTWIREPERHEKFLEDAALLEVQKGSPLSVEEIRRLKEYHANGWTEITGEFIYDPVNLVPAALLEKVLGIPFKAVSKVNKALVEAFPVYGKTLHVLGSPIRWIRRETVHSGGNRIMNSTYNLMERMLSAYSNADEFTKGMDQVGSLIEQARRVPGEQAARAIFERGKETIPAMEQITFKDFKSLMDAGEHIDPKTWSKLYSDALIKAEDDIIALAEKRGVDPTDLKDEISKAKRASLEVSNTFRSAFVDAHRIYKGSSFVDDTISGWVTKTMRELSGEEMNDLLKVNKFDEVVMKYGETLDPGWRKFWMHSGKGVEHVLHATGFLRDVWATVVLSTPRWIMSNLPDTAMRSAVYGGNVWDDLVTLFTSTQRHFADELGFVPTEFVQSLARDGLEFSESVPVRLLYEGWKPKAGLFSYFGYEYKRLLGTDPFLAKKQVIEGMLSGLPDGKLKNALGWLADGVGVKMSPSLAFKTWAGGIADFNTAIEFTYRLRMFHREYFKLLEKIEPKFMQKGLEGLSPAAKEIAAQIWKNAEGNPRRVSAYVESLVGKAAKKGTPAQWSLIVPPEIEKVTKGMDAIDRQLFISSVRNQLDDFMEASTKAGKEITADDFARFFDDYKKKFQDEIQARMAKSHDWRDIDTSISKEGSGETVDIPNPGDLKGSAPIPSDQAPRNIQIEKATGRLDIKKRLQSTSDVAKDFEAAISDIAKVERVADFDGVRRVMKDGQVVIEIGDKALKKSKALFYRDLHNTLIDVFKHTDTDAILRSGFKNVDEYEIALRSFLTDKEGPTRLLHDNERQFIAIVNELESHPQLKTLLERTSGERFRYDAAMDIYRDAGVYSDVYGFTKKPTEIFESEAQRLRPLPGDHVAAAQDSAKSTVDLARLEPTLPPALADKVAQFREYFGVYREELKQFFAFTYPGPLMKSTRDAERHIGWDKFYKLATEEFRKEKIIKDNLIELLKSDPAAADKYLDDAFQNFGEYFLRENGITLEWDADMQKLMNMKYVSPLDGRMRNFTADPDLAHLHMRFFSKEVDKKLLDNPILRVRTDARTKLANQLRNNLRDIFDLPNYQAEAWARVIQKHAERWSEVTGQDVSKYYERLGFQKLEGGTFGLSTKETFRVVKRGAVQRAKDGTFMFYGLGQSTFESAVRETGELFFDDLISMAEHSDQAASDLKGLREYLEKEAGKPIFANKLDQSHSNALADLFTKYVGQGSAPDIKLKRPFETFKEWMTRIYEGVKGSPLEGDLADDTRQILDRLFVEEALASVPKTNQRTVKLMAQEAGVEFKTDDELLEVINDAIAPITTEIPTGWNEWVAKGAFANFPPEALADPQAFRQYVKGQLDQALRDLEKEFEPLLKETEAVSGGLTQEAEDLLNKVDQGGVPAFISNNLKKIARENGVQITDEMKATDVIEALRAKKIPAPASSIRDELLSRLASQKKNLTDEYDRVLTSVKEFIPRPIYTSIGDVPKDVAAKALGVPETKISKELQEGWEVWKTQRGLRGFPDEALTSPDTFKAYLKERQLAEWSEPAAYYNRLMWEVEQFEDAMLNYHAGQEFADVIFPRIPEAQISDGMKTFIRNQEDMINNYESSLQALDVWQSYLMKIADEGHPGFMLPKEAQAELLAWGKKASATKAEMIDVLLRGGTVDGTDYTGAINTVNKAMIDYQHSNLFDQFMKNFFPFWKFPSRSFPFWVETMATHPQIIAAYEKIQRLSRSQRYQAGAVTSQGKPLPSLNGYIKLPGTDLWFNPLAPFSFRYVLDIARSKDDAIYDANSEDDIEPKAFLAKEMIQSGPIYGFNFAPWITYLMKQAYNIPDEVLPSYPLAPEISLIPRWMVADTIRKANKINFFGMEIKGLGDAAYPEAPWHDYLVERRILESVYAQIGQLPDNDPRRRKLLSDATSAIKYKGENELWQQTYKELTSEEWTHSMSSFFTGIYPKEFSDQSAEMRALINDMNLLKSALNNEFQATVFDIPTDAHQAYDKYLNTLSTPEGWVYRLYTDIGWVKDDQGQLQRDPAERAKWLALKIKQDEDQQIYYDKMSDLQRNFNEQLRALPIGAPWEQVKGIYDQYAEERSSLQYLRSFEKYYGTNKPTQIIMEDITRDWFKAVKETKPTWNLTGGETYDQYQGRVKEWENNLPNIAPLLMRAFRRSGDLNNVLSNLKADQQFDQKYFGDLVKMANVEGIKQWEIDNDDVFDALNKAWDATYWGEYWDSVVGSKGYQTDLIEKDFYTRHPQPPNAQELYQWISIYYGPERFTFDEIAKWVDGTGELSVQQRQLATKEDPQDYQTRQQIWDMLSWVGPGNKNRGVFETAYANAGGDPDALTVWYEESGEAYRTQPEKLNKLQAAIQQAIKDMGLQSPSRPELVRYVQAQKENDTFKQAVSDELGNQFFDWKDDKGEPHLGIYGYYNSLDKESRKEFRGSYPEEYGLIQDYYAMRDQFSVDHPVWGDYYGAETTPSVTLPENKGTGSVLTPPSRYRPKGGGAGGGKPAYSPLPTVRPRTSEQSIPSFYLPSRTGGPQLSRDLLRVVGEKMAQEIANFYSSNKPISQSGITFLRSVASRYPKFRKEIESILGRT